MDNANSNKPQLGELARNGNYVRLFCAQIIGALGDRLHQMALLNFVIAVTGTSHSVKHIADITFWGIFPAVVFGPIAMACMDRWPWKKTMVVSTLLRALLAVMMPQILLAWPDVHTVWSTAFLLGTFAAVFGPARLALMPNLVPARNLTTANAVSSQVGTVATILGILLGGFLVHHLGSVYGDTAGRSYAFYADAVCFGISLALILLLRPQSARKKPVHHESHWLSDFRVGIRYVRRHSDIAFTIALFGFLMLVSGLVYGCLFQYTIDLLKYSEDKIGALFAVLGTGMAAGAVLLVLYPKLGERPFLPFGGLAATGLLFWALGWEHPAGFAWPATLVFGIGVSGIFALIPNDTYLQRQVPDNVRGRVFVVRNVIGAIAWMGSLQLVKSLVHQFGVLHSLAGLGIVTLAVAALTAAIFAARLERPTL